MSEVLIYICRTTCKERKYLKYFADLKI